MKFLNSTKRTKLYNIVMISVIMLGIIIGIVTVGSVKGWFSKEKPVTIVDSDGSFKSVDINTFNKSGNVNIERDGLSFNLTEGMKLRTNDVINTLTGSGISIEFGESKVVFNENTKCELTIDDKGQISLELKSGEAFSSIQTLVTYNLMGRKAIVNNAVFSASVPYGSATVNVFKNRITIDNKAVDSGNSISILKNEVNICKLSVESLNDFNLKNIQQELKTSSLCFTKQDISNVQTLRKAAARNAIQAKLLTEKDSNMTNNEKDNTNSQKDTNSKKVTQSSNSEKNQSDSSSSEKQESSKSDSSEQGNESQDNSKQEMLSCTITIVCNTVLNNLGDLEEGKEPYVPSDGIILEISKVNFKKGETAFDVLKRVCLISGIQLEYSWTPMYDSYYIEGINNLYQFDCGFESGWMYKVNEWFPNYGCSSYKLKDNDNIVWCYTCKGLGADVGGSVY